MKLEEVARALSLIDDAIGRSEPITMHAAHVDDLAEESLAAIRAHIAEQDRALEHAQAFQRAALEYRNQLMNIGVSAEDLRSSQRAFLEAAEKVDEFLRPPPYDVPKPAGNHTDPVKP
jgi:hypothetical protein